MQEKEAGSSALARVAGKSCALGTSATGPHLIWSKRASAIASARANHLRLIWAPKFVGQLLGNVVSLAKFHL